MDFQVRCAGCNRYFSLDEVKQEGNGYYCRTCYKHLNRGPSIPITTNRETRCYTCDRIIGPGDARVGDGYFIYCLECYNKKGVPFLVSEKASAGKDGTGQRCSACGKPYALDGLVQENGRLLCKKCHEKLVHKPVKGLMQIKGGFLPSRGATAVRDPDKLIECRHCGIFVTADRLRADRDGKLRCPKCDAVVPAASPGASKPKKDDSSVKIDDLSIKNQEYSTTAQLFKCLGDPCRVKVIELLSDHELCVFEFVEMTGFQYSAISYHLKLLKEFGVVQSSERGNFMVYSLTAKGQIVHEFIKKSKEIT